MAKGQAVGPGDFNAWIRQVMDSRGWDQATLAEKMGVTPGTVSRVLLEQRQPGNDFLRGFARATGYRTVDVFVVAFVGKSGTKYLRVSSLIFGETDLLFAPDHSVKR